MKKKITAIVLAAAMVFTLVIPSAAASDIKFSTANVKDLENATRVITEAVSELNGTFPAEQAGSVIDIFKDIYNAANVAGNIVVAINGSVNFLRLIGLMKDPNSEALTNISAQMQDISENIAMMDKKLDNISAQMSKLQASVEFNARTQKSMLLEQNWKDFQYRYEEEGMDALMTEYNSMLLNGLQTWCRNSTENARTVNGIDNSRLILVYNEDYELYNFSDNSIPSDLPEGAHVLVLSDKLLPQKVDWNVNTYRKSIRSAVAGLIGTAVAAGDFDAFYCENFPEFTEEGYKGLTPDLIDRVSEDAVNVLVHRIACGCINADSSFSLDVKRQFLNYCSHLAASDDGIDAVIKTFFLTHAFEFEVSSDIKNFCNEMAVKAGTYGAFALNVMGLSDYATEEDKAGIINAYCSTLKTIGDAKEYSLTGKKQYCYITNTELYLGEVRFSADAEVETKENAVTAFRSASGGSITSKLTGSWDKSFMPDRNSLIGDSDILLLAYTMQSSTGPVTFDYLRTHLSNGYIQNCNTFVSSYNNETTLPLNSEDPMRAAKISGDYFSDGSNYSFSNLPSDVKKKTGNFLHRRMVNGTVFNFGTLSSETKMLSGLAIYGENHWYWTHDEIAILGNNPYQSNFMSFLDRIRQSYQYYFNYEYSQNVSYNCLVRKNIIKGHPGDGGYDPLEEYGKLNKKIENDSNQQFDDVSLNNAEYDAVLWSAQNGITYGVGNNKFGPDKACTRGQMVTFLWRAVGRPVSDDVIKFTDVKKDSYYSDAVQWAVSEGIVKGVTDEEFRPNAICTRAEAVTFLARFDGAKEENAVTAFTDVNEKDYFSGAVKWAVDKGITKGTSKVTFSPDKPCTRIQTVSFLYRLIA